MIMKPYLVLFTAFLGKGLYMEVCPSLKSSLGQMIKNNSGKPCVHCGESWSILETAFPFIRFIPGIYPEVCRDREGAVFHRCATEHTSTSDAESRVVPT